MVIYISTHDSGFWTLDDRVNFFLHLSVAEGSVAEGLPSHLSSLISIPVDLESKKSLDINVPDNIIKILVILFID